MLTCRFCDRECQTTQSLAQHQSRCKNNPKRVDPSSWATGNRKGIPSWNAGLKNDPRCKLSDASKQKLSKIASERKQSVETNLKRKTTIDKKVKSGEWHTSLASKMYKTYAGEIFHGSWEVAYAKFLDSVGTSWDRNTRSFSYEFEGKQRRYTPDFYLPLEDVYVEIKGYKTEKDDAKWKQFPERLVVLMKEELIELGLI